MSKLIIVIPALNEENLIKSTLESLNCQNNLNFSLIVVDNGSTDGTSDIVKQFSKSSKYPIEVIKEDKPGVGHARNTGMHKALELGATYIAGTDADTTFPSDWVDSIYKGFENSKADLLCGESDPTREIKFNNEKVEFVLNARSILFKHVKPYFRGYNYAITSDMFKLVGSIKQPLTADGKTAPGEDVGLEMDVLSKGGKILGCLSTVFPHPRRYISLLNKVKEFKGQMHEGGVVTQVRNEKQLERELVNVPTEVFELFADKTLESQFFECIVHVYKEPAYKNLYWENASKMLKPFSVSEIEKDIQTLTNDKIWEKYKDAFISNIETYIS